MIYKEYLKKLKKCPFCNLKKSEIILENEDAILTLAKAPYVKNHMLVFPKKHKTKFYLMKNNEQKNVLELVKKGVEKLKKIEKSSVSVLYREGNKKDSGKSISHLHMHIIPKMRIGSTDINSEEREIYSERDYLDKIKKVKKKLNEK